VGRSTNAERTHVDRSRVEEQCAGSVVLTDQVFVAHDVNNNFEFRPNEAGDHDGVVVARRAGLLIGRNGVTHPDAVRKKGRGGENKGNWC